MKIGVAVATAGLLLGVAATPGTSSAATPGPAAVAAPAVESSEVSALPIPVATDETARRTGRVAELAPVRTAPFALLGVTWDPASTPAGVDVEVRLHGPEGWGAWEHLEYAGDEGPAAGEDSDARAGTAPLWVGAADGVAVRIGSGDGTAPLDPRVVTVSAEQAADARQSRSVAKRRPKSGDRIRSAPRFPNIPRVISRRQWGANPSMGDPCWAPRYGSSAKMVFVHHTAGSSRYSPRESPAIVRSIYAYHTQGQNWCDIGYNALIDRFGNIYEGRRGGIRKPVRGAHAGDWNTNAVGVSLMGNFQRAEPTRRILNALVRFAGWRLGSSFTPVRGSTSIAGRQFARISGHRDAMSTSCPGSNVYDRLPRIRKRVASYLSRYHPKAERKARKLGAARTGPVFVGEQWSHGGRITRFAKGRMYVKPGLGAHWLTGRVLKRYRNAGGVTGRLGWPRTDVGASTVRRVGVIGFERGRAYVPPGKAVRVLYGRILDRYARLHYAKGRLGLPTSSIRAVPGGARATFRHGVARWDRSTDTVRVEWR